MELISALSVETILEFQVIRRLISVKTTSKARGNAALFVRRGLKAGNFEMTTPDKEEMPTEDRTAGPWRLSLVSDAITQEIWSDTVRPELFATCRGQRARANAAFIVTACNAYEPMREALSKIANCGQSQEPDHWQFRVMARDTSNAALSTLPVNNRHHSGSDNEREPFLDELTEQIEKRVKADLAEIYRPSADDETRAWKAAIIDIVGASRQTSDDVGRLREALAMAEAELARLTADIDCGPWKSTRPMRVRAAELARFGGYVDDYDRAVLAILEDFERLERLHVANLRAALEGVPQPAKPNEAAHLESVVLEALRPYGEELTRSQIQMAADVVVREFFKAGCEVQPASEAGKLSTDEVL